MGLKLPSMLDLSITVEDCPDTQTLWALAGSVGRGTGVVLDLHSTWLIVRDRNERVIGGLQAKTFGKWFLVTRLRLEPDYRRMGLGAKLLGDAERIARERHCTDIFLDTARFPSSEFYTQLGFSGICDRDYNPLGLGRTWLLKTLPISAANDAASLAENGVGG
jgi:GNAT superfamily N-acetyltransferase